MTKGLEPKGESSLKERAISTLVALAVILVALAVHGQEKAAVTASGTGQFEAGGAITLHMKLDRALPEGANVRIEVSPRSVNQWIALFPGEPENPSRTTFKITGKLPDNAVPGEWTVRNVWLFLPGSTQGQSLSHNQTAFEVKGRPFPIPTGAEITVPR